MSQPLRSDPNNLEALWMPFTANRQFKRTPRLLVGAKDMHYTASDGRQILDGTAGLWGGNSRPFPEPITPPIPAPAAEIGLPPGLQMRPPVPLPLAARPSPLPP